MLKSDFLTIPILHGSKSEPDSENGSSDTLLIVMVKSLTNITPTVLPKSTVTSRMLMKPSATAKKKIIPKSKFGA